MAVEIYTNEPSTTVGSPGGTTAGSGSETWTVASSAGWPAASNGASPPTQFHAADPALPSELFAVTNVSGTTWTVTRGAESTTPVAHAAGFTVMQVITAGGLNSVLPLSGGTMSGAVAMGAHKVTGLANGSASTDAVNLGQVPAITGANVALTNAPSGATGVTWDRGMLAVTANPSNTHTTLYVRALALPAGVLVSNITFCTGTPTVQAGGSHGWYCLLDSGLVVRAITADQTGATTWGTANTVYTLSVAASAYTTTYTGLYYVGFCTTSTTEPVFASGAGLSTTFTNIPPILMGSCTGQAAPFTTGSTVSAITGNATYNFLAWTS